eukprot:5706444-Pleurochrysis_carterae.AAC.1
MNTRTQGARLNVALAPIEKGQAQSISHAWKPRTNLVSRQSRKVRSSSGCMGSNEFGVRARASGCRAAAPSRRASAAAPEQQKRLARPTARPWKGRELTAEMRAVRERRRCLRPVRACVRSCRAACLYALCVCVRGEAHVRRCRHAVRHANVSVDDALKTR